MGTPDREHNPAIETEHPSYGDLLQFTVTPHVLSEKVRAQIEAHLPGCLKCTGTKKTMEEWPEEDRKLAEQIEAMDWGQLLEACNKAFAEDDAATLSSIAEKCIRALEQDRNNAAALSILIEIAQKGAGVAKPRAEKWLMKNGVTFVEGLS